jgi:hypothetical protein
MTKGLFKVYEIFHNVAQFVPNMDYEKIVGIGQNLAYNHAIDSRSFPNGHCLVFDKL